MRLRRPVLAAVLLACLAPAGSAQAALYQLDFTGVISNSRDSGGAVFGNSSAGGQDGETISGHFTFDDAAYADQDGSEFNGAYGPLGAFPQPANLIQSSYTIAGQTFQPGRWMGAPSGHSLEFAAVQDIPPLNFVQQDILQIHDGSQMLVCTDPEVASTCSGGASAADTLQLKLFGIVDFVASDALAQVLEFNAAGVADIIGAPGGGQTNFYSGYRDAGSTRLHDFGGEFNLTSIRLGPAPIPTPGAVPEPESPLLLALGIVGLVLLRRSRTNARRHG